MAVTVVDDRTALVLIDLQVGTLAAPTQPYAAADVVTRAAELADAFRAAGLPVVLVRMATAPDGADAVRGRSEAARRAGGTSRPYDLGPIAEQLAGHDGDILVTKRNWGAFYGTDLDLQLRRRGVTQIVLGGVATSLGVESTARAAHEHGYHVTFAVDAMTDINGAAHEHSVSWVFPLIGEPGTTEEIVDLLAKSPS
ncbi:isochorismatase family protein [Streptomyces sp. NPDC002088]|uniref:isochorismatase family protein n=1 Tax=Streptomyces sp. NPDC002088 TaxID=3154665 RepID=UPI00331FBFF9